VKLHVAGQVKLKLSARSAGLFETLKPLVPLVLFAKDFIVLPPGRVAEGLTSAPFEFTLPSTGLYESYHGVYVTIVYNMYVTCERGVLSRPLSNNEEFVVEIPEASKQAPEAETFSITPEALENVQESSISKIPKFNITGRIFTHKRCPVDLPFTGEITVHMSEAALKSITLELVRVETVKNPDSGKTAREATEIQAIQIADGDVCRNLVIPLYMIFPRLFTCRTMATDTFKIEFEINLIIAFTNGYMITEVFPIELHREK